MIFVYTRVSTDKTTQKADRQVELITRFLQENNIDVNTVEFQHEIISGKVAHTDRLIYTNLKDKMRAGDVLLVSDLDRLGRDVLSLKEELLDLQKKKISLVCLDTPFLDKLPSGNEGEISLNEMVIDVLVAVKMHVAKQEREKTRERILQGLAASNKKSGRPNVTKDNLPQDFYRHYPLLKSKKIKRKDLCKMLDITYPTLRKYIRLAEEN